ncbi:MAG TPA: HEXXH motif-containing putative peptide modification protein [Elusimicrobiota bacterium]|jgi:HEXXH motif-containing protein|nr:HEXXH motif-containing putative peptide modification protein [Elusimicrobiota bacterium]
MRLDEGRWILGGGLDREWAWVGRERALAAARALRDAARAARGRAPAGVRARAYGRGFDYVLALKGRERARLLAQPALDYWLHLWERHFSRPVSEDDWHLQLGLFQGFAASAALGARRPLRLDAACDPDGRFHFHGSPHYLEFDAPPPGRRFTLRLEPESVRVEAPGLSRSWPRSDFDGEPAADGGARVRLRRSPRVADGIIVEDRSWLMVHGVTMHGLARLDGEPAERFSRVLREALEAMRERDPALHAELTDMIKALIPLVNSESHGSVSSSYMNLKGAIALSHSEDPLLQAETLIHEFCHQKMNQLLAADPILLPGQSGQVFYSPWRPDARRLRGLLLGAHAFLNVARYLARSLAREARPEAEEIEIMVNVARRVNQVDLALRAVAGYASLTEFGRRFVLGMWRELALLQHAVLWFPPALLAEQRAACEEHRRRFGLSDTGFHRGAGLVDGVPRAAFQAPKP